MNRRVILQPDRQILLLACSNRKDPRLASAEARYIYAGTMFKLGFQWAQLAGFDVMIISAKYGLISPTQVITTYDQKLTTQYEGPWPDGTGYYLGGKLYFGRAPAHYQRLVPESTNGLMMARVKRLIEELQGRP